MDEFGVDVNKSFTKHLSAEKSNSQTQERLRGEYEDICQEVRNVSNISVSYLPVPHPFLSNLKVSFINFASFVKVLVFALSL